MTNQEKVLREKLEAFKQSAKELSRAWEGVEWETEVNAGVNDNYPFQKDFNELVHEITEWGKPKEPEEVRQLRAFKANMERMLGDLNEALIQDEDIDERFDLNIELYGERIALPMHADTYSRLERFIDDAIEEELQ